MVMTQRPNAVGAECVNLCHGYVHQPVISWQVEISLASAVGDAFQRQLGRSFRCGWNMVRNAWNPWCLRMFQEIMIWKMLKKSCSSFSNQYQSYSRTIPNVLGGQTLRVRLHVLATISDWKRGSHRSHPAFDPGSVSKMFDNHCPLVIRHSIQSFADSLTYWESSTTRV